MANCDLLFHLVDHDYSGSRTLSAHRAERPRRSLIRRQCSCCCDHQQHPAPAARKRKQTSAPRPSQPPAVPCPALQATTSPGELLPVPRPCTPPLQQVQELQIHQDLQIHGHSMEEYQQLYHAVVDPLLRFKNGSCRPYSLHLGRRLKQELWELLGGPTFKETVNDDGLVTVDASYVGGAYPPRYDVDTSGEPEPYMPPVKRTKH